MQGQESNCILHSHQFRFPNQPKGTAIIYHREDCCWCDSCITGKWNECRASEAWTRSFFRRKSINTKKRFCTVPLEEKKNEPIVGFSPKRGSIQFAKIISDPIKATATHVNEATAEGMFEICSKEWIVKACLVKTEPDSPTCDTITTSVIIVPVRCVVVHSEVPNRGDDTTYIHLQKSPRGYGIPSRTRTAYKNLAY